VNEQDPRQVLAQRLRALREQRWPGRKVNQSQLAAALGGDGNSPVSVPLVSSWESQANPKVPSAARLQDIATFFASPRSFDGRAGRLLRPDEMTAQEQAAREELLQELTRLRSTALNAPPPPRLRASAAATAMAAPSLYAGPYRLKNGEIITIVCAQLPDEMLQRMPYTDPLDPDFVELYTFADLDALLELFGHMRAANPSSRVQFRAAGQLGPDEYQGHLVPLGGVDWNEATSSVLDRLQLPVRQVSDWDKEGGVYFEVTGEDGRKVPHHPQFEESGGRTILREDVALFARAVNPFNQKRFVTICNGMYGRGTYGAVRALTDERFRDRNAEYIQDRSANSEAFCILTRVTVENGVTLTPDWTLPETRLFEWSRPQ
jgi:transcriptional regulator with XRE-family HTH domain